MKLTFLGATHEVTGSCFYLNACGKNIVIDFGMEQGPDTFENQSLPIGANAVDFVLLTHAHIDHSGKLPCLYKEGFTGEIHSTDATADLCNIMLRDSAHIQEFEAEWRNRKGRRAGHDEFVPLYTMEDALGSISQFVPHPFDVRYTLCEGIEINFIYVGHLLGSASIEIFVTESGITKKLVFSGDIGNTRIPLLRDPQYIQNADYVIMESTYGDRTHGEKPDYVMELTKIIQETFDNGGNLIIPSFAVGRTQELLYYIREIKDRGLVKGFGNFQVYVDSPLAVEATGIFNENSTENYDKEALELLAHGINPISFDGLNLSITSEDSKSINFNHKPKVIISASGMCDAGRIKHHLKHNLWRKESTILFVGYQAVGTLGRAILEGATSVKLFGETIEISARIERLQGVSGHADRDGLLNWLYAFEKKPSRVFVVHGEDQVATNFKRDLEDMEYTASAPYSGDIYDLISNEKTHVAKIVKIVKQNQFQNQSQSQLQSKTKSKGPSQRATPAFDRLIASVANLLTAAQKCRKLSNKEISQFTSQINTLTAKLTKRTK